MSRYTQTNVSTITGVNSELQKIALAISSSLDRKGSTPNYLQADLDVNSNDILNVKALDVNSIVINGQLVTYDSFAGTTLPAQSGHSGKLLTTNGTTASWVEKEFVVHVADDGALGDGIYGDDGVATASSATFTSASANWTASDIGKVITIQAAGVGGIVHSTTIASINSTTSIELTTVAVTTVASSAKYVYGTDDTSSIQLTIDNLWDATADQHYIHANGTKNRPHGEVHFTGSSTYMTTGIVVPDGIKLIGHGCTLDSSTAAPMIKVAFNSTTDSYNGYSGTTYYAGAHGGIEDFTLVGNDLATKGVWCHMVNWSDFKHVYVHNCVVNWYLGEVQYSLFESCFAYNGSIGWIISGKADDSLASIDNTFIRCVGNRNNKYGWWLQASTKSSFIHCDGSLNEVCNVLIGGQLVGYLPSYTITAAGSGYPVSSYQTVTISGGTGTEAQAYAEIDGGGTVIGIYSLDGGSGYTTGHAISVGGGGSGATATATAVDDSGLGDWDGTTGIVRGGNTFYDFKLEITRDNVPSCGYAVWQRTGRDNAFYEVNFHRQSSGTARPSTYCKLARCDDFGLSFSGFGEALSVGANIGQRPDNTSDISIVRSTATTGMYLTALNYTFAGLQNSLVVDASDSSAVGGKAVVVTTDTFGRTITKPAFLADTASDYADYRVDGDSNPRMRLYPTGEQRWGTGSTTEDVIVKRPSAGGAILSMTTGDNYALPSETGITAFATGGQGSATAMTKSINEISTCATIGDSVKLPTATAGIRVTVINNGATACDVFPFSGDNIGAGADTAVSLASGANITYAAYNTTNWIPVT